VCEVYEYVSRFPNVSLESATRQGMHGQGMYKQLHENKKEPDEGTQ